MTPNLPPHSKIKISTVKTSPSQEKEFRRFVWLLFGGPVLVAIVAVNTNHILGSVFIGVAVIVLILTIRMDMPLVLFGLATSLVLVGFGLLIIIPWDTSSGPGLTNDDRYRKLLGESAYSCQAGHYDEQNCRAQKQGLDDVAKWLNGQKR